MLRPIAISRARGPSALSAIRALGKRKIDIIAIDSMSGAPGFFSKYVSEKVLHIDYYTNLGAYIEFLTRFCVERDVLTVLPTDEITVFVLSKHSDLFPASMKTIWPKYNKLQIVQDRVKLFQIAKELDIPAPNTFSYDPLHEIPETVTFPLVIKRRNSVEYKNNKAIRIVNRYVFGTEELHLCAAEIAEKCGSYPIVQEYIPGEGYGFFALYNKGRLKAKFQHHRLRESNYKGGISSYRESVNIPQLEKEGIKIGEALGWHGPIMVEFKRDPRDDKFKLIEVNPRFWGSLNLAVLSGIDFPYLFYQMANWGDCDESLDYKVGIKSKIFNADLSHLLSILLDKGPPLPQNKPSFIRSFLGVLCSSLTISDDYFSFNDPGPFFREVANGINSYRNLVERLRG